MVVLVKDPGTQKYADGKAGTGAGSGLRVFMGPIFMLLLLLTVGRLGGHYWQTIQGQIAASGPVGMLVYWLVLIGLAAACFPVSALGFSGGALFGWWPGWGLVFSGGVVAGLLMFWLGGRLFRRRIHRYIQARPRLRVLDRLAGEQALRLNLLTRLSPFNFGIASYALAAGRPSLRDYGLGLLATVPSITVWVWLGDMARKAAGDAAVRRDEPWWLLGVALVFLVLLSWQVGRLARKALTDSDASDAHGAGTASGGKVTATAGFWQNAGAEEVLASGNAWEWNLKTRKFNLSRQLMVYFGFPELGPVVPATWIQARVHPADEGRVRQTLGECLRRQEPGLTVEFRFKKADGKYIWLQALAVAMWNRAGRARALAGTVTDITSRVAVAEERDLLFNLSPDLLASSDFQGNLHQVNPAWVRILGWSRDDLLRRPLPEFVTGQDREAVRGMLADLAAGRTIEGLETRWLTRSGQVRWLSWNCSPLPGQQRFFAAARDITRRKDAEARIQQYQGQLRDLSYQMSLVEDRQRQQLAVALHDGLAQQLFAVRAQATLLKYPDRLDDVQAVVAGILELLDETMAETRSLSFEIFPPALRDLGLEGALRWLGDQFEKRRGLQVTLRCRGEEPDLPRDLRSLLFQSCRELLSNVVKHARCDRAEIELVFGPDRVELVVRDEGGGSRELNAGEPSDARDVESGFGLFSIRERLRAVGGAMRVHSVFQQGTTVSLVLPLAVDRETGAGD